MGFFGDLWGGFTGESQKKALAAGKQASDAALQSGYDQGKPYLQQASNAFAPYAQSGQQANQFYNDALGLNGDAARTTATNTLTSNPLFQGQLGQDSNAMSRILNAQGASGGGKAQLAAQRVFQQTAGNWLDRYAQQGQQGLQAANGQANAFTNQGNYEYGYGATRAGQETQNANAMAQASGIGINNLLGVAGLGVKAAGLFGGSGGPTGNTGFNGVGPNAAPGTLPWN